MTRPSGPKMTMARARLLVAARGYKLLSTEIQNTETPLLIYCPRHGPFTRTIHAIQKGRKCQKCGRPRRSLEVSRRIVTERGYQLLSIRYRNVNEKMQIMCPKHGEFQKSMHDVKKGAGCPGCARRPRLDIDQVRTLVKEKGYDLIATEYENVYSPIALRCSLHGEFRQRLAAIKRGHGCQQCGRARIGKHNPRETPREVQDQIVTLYSEGKPATAISRKLGLSLTRVYWTLKRRGIARRTLGQYQTQRIGALSRKLELRVLPGGAIGKAGDALFAQCPCARCGTKRWVRIEGEKPRSTRCMNCNEPRPKVSIEKIARVAMGRNYPLLSAAYAGNKAPLSFGCDTHGPFSMTWNSFSRGQGCPKCGIERRSAKRRLNVKKVDEYCLALGYERLSSYDKNSTKLTLRCVRDGSTFQMRFNDLQFGHGCPTCNASIGSYPERLCRYYFEFFTGKPFVRQRPAWLDGLEVDGYNDELRLGFEYNGRLHRLELEHFYREKDGPRSFSRRLENDRRKQAMFSAAGRRLVVIGDEIHARDLGRHIHQELSRLGVRARQETIPKPREMPLLVPRKWEGKLEYYQSYSRDPIIGPYRGSQHALTRSCLDCNRTYETIPYDVKKGRACPFCGGSRLAVDALEKLIGARSQGRGGLVGGYKPGTKLRITDCGHGHEFKASAYSLRRCSWCPQCTNAARKSLLDYQVVGLQSGLWSLALAFQRTNTTAPWQCAECGHFVLLRYASVAAGQACKYCWFEGRRRSRTGKLITQLRKT